VDFDFFALLAKGRVWSDADSGRPCLAVDGSRSGVDSVCRQQSVNLSEVGGGEADRAASLGTPVHKSDQAIGAAEQTNGFGHSAATEQSSDAAGRDHLVAGISRSDNSAGDAGFKTELLQGGDGTSAISTEVEIGAFNDSAGVKLVLNNLLEKLVRSELQQAGAHWQNENGVDTGFEQQSSAFVRGCEQWRGEFGLQHSDWVWLEGDGCCRHGAFACEFDKLFQHGDVARMDSVKVADADAGTVE